MATDTQSKLAHLRDIIAGTSSAVVAVVMILSLFMAACSTERAAAERLERQLNKGQTATFYVLYEMTGLDDEETLEGTMTVAQSPPKWRMDVTGDGEHYALVWDGKHDYNCFSESRPRTCERYTPADPSEYELTWALDPGKPFGQTLAENLGTANVRELPQREVIGQMTACFEAVDDFDEGSWLSVICLSDDGIPLYEQITSELEGYTFHVTFEATRLASEIPKDHFSPPYPVQ